MSQTVAGASLIAEWQHEVTNDYTRLGFDEWCAHQREQDEDDATRRSAAPQSQGSFGEARFAHEHGYTNLDARELAAFGDRLARGDLPGNEDLALLARAAQHLQRMDEKIARHIDGTLAAGTRLAELRAASRSNILRGSRPVSNSDGETIIAALAEPGRVRKAKLGESGLRRGETIEIIGRKSVAARKGHRLEDL